MSHIKGDTKYGYIFLGYAQELPEGFDASEMLPGADASSKESITDTFPLVFVLRWLLLRNEVCRHVARHRLTVLHGTLCGTK